MSFCGSLSEAEAIRATQSSSQGPRKSQSAWFQPPKMISFTGGERNQVLTQAGGAHLAEPKMLAPGGSVGSARSDDGRKDQEEGDSSGACERLGN